MRKVELAWAAGFVDADGCFSLRKEKNERFSPAIQINQVDTKPLKRLLEIFGEGHLYQIGRQNGNKSDLFAAQLKTKDGCRRVLKKLIPYLVLKRLKAEVLLASLEYSSDERFPYYCFLRCLNQRGPNKIKPGAALVRGTTYRSHLRILS